MVCTRECFSIRQAQQVRSVLIGSDKINIVELRSQLYKVPISNTRVFQGLPGWFAGSKQGGQSHVFRGGAPASCQRSTGSKSAASPANYPVWEEISRISPILPVLSIDMEMRVEASGLPIAWLSPRPITVTASSSVKTHSSHDMLSHSGQVSSPCCYFVSVRREL